MHKRANRAARFHGTETIYLEPESANASQAEMSKQRTRNFRVNSDRIIETTGKVKIRAAAGVVVAASCNYSGNRCLYWCVTWPTLRTSTGTGGHCSRIHDYYLRAVNSKGIPKQIAAHMMVSVYWHGAIRGAYPRTVAGSMATRVFPSTVADTLIVCQGSRTASCTISSHILP